jgi:GSCFA family.
MLYNTKIQIEHFLRTFALVKEVLLIMIDYSTKVTIPKSDFNITYNEKLIFIGSCFADNIGLKMREHKFDALTNPFGVLYNPMSVALACRHMPEPGIFVEDDLFFYDGLYHSHMHHGKFSDVSADRCLSGINNSSAISSEHFHKTSFLVITFGTSYVYHLKEDGRVVANCHKLPASHFDRRLLTVDGIVEEWSELLEYLWLKNPLLKIIFTVSPIRHWKDGANLNQISKATLLLAQHSLIEKYPDRISYFPAYELMMDELRDYRFYADDMLHPSKIAIDYIWERFCDTYMDISTTETLKNIDKLCKTLNHRPLNTSTEAYKHFLTQTMLNLKRLQEKYPYICLSEEEKMISNKLKE